MNRRADPLIAIINAARHVAAERIGRALRGELPKLPAFLAAVALDVTHAFVMLYGDEPRIVEDMGTIRSQPVHFSVEAREPAYAQQVPPSEHGPN